MNVSYDDRFKWHLEMLESDLDPTAKAVLGWLWASLDMKTGRAARHLDTIAAKMKMKKATVRAALARAKSANWISWTGAGGIVHDIEGKRRGLACSFAMDKPANQLARYDTCEPRGGNVLTKSGQGANEVAVTCEPVSTNTLSSLSSTPIHISKAAHADGGEVEVLGYSPQQTIFDAVSLWGEFWPKEVAKVSAINTEAPDRWVRGRLDDVALNLLGWQSRTADENHAWAEISRRLKMMDFSALIDLYRADVLTTAHIAEALAAEKILPPSIDPAVIKEGGYAKAS